tara:strand:- start:12473 stop:13261 length:789 start_codon:yes stop_codon:yes gene_type:complete
MSQRSHISFSELKIWNECPLKHKLTYIDELKEFVGNEHTAFGKAVHDVCEQLLTSEEKFNTQEMFEKNFLNELTDLEKAGVELRKSLVQDMRAQGRDLVGHILPAVKDHFKTFEVISAEEELYEALDGIDFNYKGFIDLVLKTPDGKYHVIDWKTCSWGWDSKRKNDRMTGYQLTFYKHFFALKHEIDPGQIETHFALLKRTAKKNKVEIFKITSGQKKTENALNLLKRALYNIQNKRFFKNRLACQSPWGMCEFYKTKHCR